MHDCQRDSHKTSQTAIYANITQTGLIRVYCRWFWVVLAVFWWFWVSLASIVGGCRWFWLVMWFRNYAENRLFAQVHAPQTKAMKQQILKELASSTSKVRVIFARVAIRLGVDMPSIRNVIVCEYFQETGRAG